MTSMRFVVFVLILCTIAIWLVSRPSAVSLAKRMPAATTTSEPLEVAGEEVDKVASSVAASRLKGLRGSPVDLRNAMRVVRAQTRAQDLTSSKQYKNFHELFDVKAASKRIYQASYGDKVREIGGYAIYGVTHSPSTLENFDYNRLPVVTDGKARTGIVNGDIAIVFRNYPSSVEQFAALYDLRLVRELRVAKTIFFTPQHLPTNLLAKIKSLSADAQVKSAELDIVFRSPVAQ